MSFTDPTHKELSGRILIVEDDREMARFLTELLLEERYVVEVEHDGSSAIERCKRGTFDLTITDLMMPGMKGTELVAPSYHRLRHHRERRGSHASRCA
jgi:CheY-like chemotaxis protein